MPYLLLLFVHLLATSMALGAIVATDLRLLAKLAQGKLRIAPPNPFVARIVVVALLMLYATGALIVWHGLGERADYLHNPKLQAKIVLVIVLTLNAVVLHRVSFPRLSRGRRVARWSAADWLAIAVPIAVSNSLWMFVAFLGIARPWNFGIALSDVLLIAFGLYAATQLAVVAILAMAGRRVEAERGQAAHWADRIARSLAAIGSLGRADAAAASLSRRARRT